MAGHSKFANIKRKKEKVDAQRGKVFTKLAKEITIATKLGGDSLTFNPRLRLAVENSKAANMPKDNIEKAIKKGMGQNQEDLIEIRYEGYAFGAAVIVDAITDNKNRTAGEVRYAFTKYGGNLGDVSWNFDRKGFILLNKNIDVENLTNLALELGADDLVLDEDDYIILTAPDELYTIGEKISNKKDSFISMIPKTKVGIDVEDRERFNKFIQALEDLDDVQEVHHNAVDYEV